MASNEIEIEDDPLDIPLAYTPMRRTRVGEQVNDIEELIFMDQEWNNQFIQRLDAIKSGEIKFVQDY